MTYGQLWRLPLIPLLFLGMLCFGFTVRADNGLADTAPNSPDPQLGGHLPEAAPAPPPPPKAATALPTQSPSPHSYPVHSGVSTTWFYVGEPSGADNNYIPNDVSAWDDSWQSHFGGVDDPNNRNGYQPAGFTLGENPFYFALPYNDLASDGSHKSNASLIPWFGLKSWGRDESALKNRWIKISKGAKSVFAQWEDVGPNGEDDVSYVFGSAKPKNTFGAHAGLDVSPAVRDFLHLSDVDTTSWQFVDASAVPSGPWRQIVTSTPVSYK